jgi:hypothetical protein
MAMRVVEVVVYGVVMVMVFEEKEEMRMTK